VTTNSSYKPAKHDQNRVPFLDVGAGYRELKNDYDAAYQRVMESGRYILGQEVEAFEAEFAASCGARYCAGVGNGLEALFLILRAYGIGPGDEVLVPAFTFIATWLAVTHTGARPVPIEPQESTFNLDPDRLASAVTPRTRAIIAVHLYGQPANMDAIREVASRHGILVIEDAAQAHGAGYRGNPAGSLADAAAFSFYPSKNLGAFGDGGAVVTSDHGLIDRIRRLRNYGALEKHDHDVCGYNSRLDPLQAAFLRVRLRNLPAWNARRTRVAQAYLQGLAGATHCVLPTVPTWANPCWHLFVIRHPERDRLRNALRSAGIETLVHYPVPPHLSGCYAGAGWKQQDFPVTERLVESVLSLPIGPHLDLTGTDRVIQSVLASEAPDRGPNQ